MGARSGDADATTTIAIAITTRTNNNGSEAMLKLVGVRFYPFEPILIEIAKDRCFWLDSLTCFFLLYNSLREE